MKTNFLGLCLLFVLSFGCNQNTSQTIVNSPSDANRAVGNSPYKATPEPENRAPAKTYAQMNDDEKSKFIAEQSDKILETFGRADGDKVNVIGLKMIKEYVDSYGKRTTSVKTDKCSFNNDLTTVLTRGSKVSKSLSGEFRSADVPVYLGIYLPMIETEYCECVSSPTGALGMFQLTAALASEYGLKSTKGATSANPDDRCNPQLAAQAAAKYIKDLMKRTFPSKMNAISYPLALATYNSSEHWIKKHISDVASFTKNENVSFWTLLETENNMPKNADYLQQFQSENKKYVPKFFAAAIIGENPRVFGVDMEPLSKIQ